MMTWSGTRRRGCGAVLDGMRRRLGGDGGATTCTKYPGGRLPLGHPPQASVSFLEMEIISKNVARKQNWPKSFCARGRLYPCLYTWGMAVAGARIAGVVLLAEW